MIALRPVASTDDQALNETLTTLALAAGGAFEIWRFGGHDEARAVLGAWIARESSEIAARRWVVAEEDGVPAGGFAALPAPELDAARRADLLALARLAARDASMVARISAARDLFLPIDSSDLYLSRIAVAAHARRHGVGGFMLEGIARLADERSLSAVRLDVSADNDAALALYEKHGFTPIAENSLADLPMRYIAMRRVL